MHKTNYSEKISINSISRREENTPYLLVQGKLIFAVENRNSSSNEWYVCFFRFFLFIQICVSFRWKIVYVNIKEESRFFSSTKNRVSYALEIRWATWTKHFCSSDVMNCWMHTAQHTPNIHFSKISSMQAAKGLPMKCDSNSTAAYSFLT